MSALARLLACGVAALIGCEGGTPPVPAPPPTPGFPSVSIAPNGRTITVGDSLQFQASTNVATITSFTWGVSSMSMATINSGGLLRALGPGTLFVQACGQQIPAACGSASLTIRP
jgi:hypothetical protein